MPRMIKSNKPHPLEEEALHDQIESCSEVIQYNKQLDYFELPEFINWDTRTEYRGYLNHMFPKTSMPKE